jgi:hypothetical protein
MPENILLDPTAETAAVIAPRLARPRSIAGKTIGLFDIAKMRGDEFLDRLDELLTVRGHTVKRYRKKHFTHLAPIELKQQIKSECDLVIEGLAD